jgi:small subunit ribosomal protein S6
MTAASQENTSVYEGMFLFPQASTGDLQAAVDHIKALLSRAGAELISLSKWDERRLAYEIKGNKRGVYFLTYFRAPREKMIALERGCSLSEQLLRTLFTRADHLSDEMMQAADGQAKLEDEIKLRKESPAAVQRATEPELQPVGAADDELPLPDSDDES